MKLVDVFLKRGFSGRLKTQIIASFLLISSVILISGFLLVYINIKNILESQVEKSNNRVLQQSEYSISSLMREVNKLSMMVIVNKDYQSIIKKEYHSEMERVELVNKVFEYLQSIQNNYEYIDSIFTFQEDGTVFGISRKYWDYVINEKKSLYSMRFYLDVKKEYPSLIWSGDFTSLDFNFYEYNIKSAVPFITAARGVIPVGEKKQSAVLVINLDESCFAPYYYNSTNSDNWNIYVINNSGKIISHPQKNQIGSKCSFFESMKDRSGGFTIKGKYSNNQVVYTKLENQDWTLVSEIPFDVFLKDIYRIKYVIFSIFAVSILSLFVMSVYWIYRLTRPLKDLIDAMYEMEKGNLGVTLKTLPKNELGLLGHRFNKMSLKILELTQENKQVETEKRRCEIEALQMQINPHFLYNTLNTIRWMAVMANVENINNSLLALGGFLKPIFNKTSPMCTILEEIDYVKNYITILNYRYGDKVKIDICIPEVIGTYKTLRFILQPLIENAITHGSINSGVLEISVTGWECQGDVFIRISDNGKGMSVEKFEEVKEQIESYTSLTTKEGKIGIANVNRRIKLHYGEKYGVILSNNYGEGVTVIVHTPVVQNS